MAKFPMTVVNWLTVIRSRSTQISLDCNKLTEKKTKKRDVARFLSIVVNLLTEENEIWQDLTSRKRRKFTSIRLIMANSP